MVREQVPPATPPPLEAPRETDIPSMEIEGVATTDEVMADAVQEENMF